jgi:hypothetical protein
VSRAEDHAVQLDRHVVARAKKDMSTDIHAVVRNKVEDIAKTVIAMTKKMAEAVVTIQPQNLQFGNQTMA